MKSPLGQHRILPVRAFLLLAFFQWAALFAQQPGACDSLKAAWQYYYDEPDFDQAEALVAGCEEPEALELRAYLACKRDSCGQAKAIICALLKQDSVYASRHKPAPVGYEALVQVLRRECFVDTSPQPPAPPIIRPEIEVLGWMHCNIGYEFIFGDEINDGENREREYFPILVHFRLGFDRLEIEFRSIEIRNDLDELKDQLMLLALKVKLLSEKASRPHFPGLTASIHTTISDVFKWNTDSFKSSRYQRSLEQLRIVATKSFESFQIHAGADIFLSITNCVYPDTIVSSQIYCQEGMPGYRKTSSYSAYALAQWWVGPWTIFTVRYNSIPAYFFEDQTKRSPRYGSLDMGARIFLGRNVTLDLMANILFNQIKISNPIDAEVRTTRDFRIRAGVTFGFSLAKFIKQPRITF